MTTSETIAIISIVCAFLSATTVTYFNFKFSVRTKKLDVLYTNQLASFKEVCAKLVSYKNYCAGKIAYTNGNEFSPFYDAERATFHHLGQIGQSLQNNALFLTQDSRMMLVELLNQMSLLCNIEAASGTGDISCNPTAEYNRMESLSESAIEFLYRELEVGKL